MHFVRLLSIVSLCSFLKEQSCARQNGIFRNVPDSPDRKSCQERELPKYRDTTTSASRLISDASAGKVVKNLIRTTFHTQIPERSEEKRLPRKISGPSQRTRRNKGYEGSALPFKPKSATKQADYSLITVQESGVLEVPPDSFPFIQSGDTSKYRHKNTVPVGPKDTFVDTPEDEDHTSQHHSENRYDSDDYDDYSFLCGDGFCRCYYEWADCSHRSNLSYIPKLPANMTRLNFSRNRLEMINNASFFENATNIQELDLSDNWLKTIVTEAFSLMHKLQDLWLNYNFDLSVTMAVRAASSATALKKLHLKDLPGQLPSYVFYRYKMPNLQDLYMDYCSMRSWNASSFEPLQQLNYLSMSDNDLRYIITIRINNLSNLMDLNLEGNDMYFFPRSCNGRNSIYPRLGRLNVKDNRINRLPKDICLPNLKVLDLSFNYVKQLSTGMFGSVYFPQLNTLFLEALHTDLRVQAFAFNNTSLKFLSLMYNNLDFASTNVDTNGFKGLTKLNQLQLEHNYLSNDRFTEVFSNCTALTHLYLGNTYLNEITIDTFANYPNLTNLTLHRNIFSTLPDGAFDGLQYLHILDLSNCRIATIGENTFSAELRRRVLHLDLSGNDFDCSCGLLWFRDWLASNDSVFNNSYTSYTCSNLPHTSVAYFTMNKQVCLMSQDASNLIVVVVTLLMVTLTLVAVVFRYRWYIRLVLYEAFRGKGDIFRLPANHFRYDVFVSYTEEDLHWVRSQLLPRLENGLGVRLCIHQRDFMPGENIVDNIYYSVISSRKIMMIFSRHFARSQWCQFELALCLQHVIDHHDALVIACIDDVTSGTDLTPTMMAVLNTTTYIQWEEELDARLSFWGRLRIALREIIPTDNDV